MPDASTGPRGRGRPKSSSVKYGSSRRWNSSRNMKKTSKKGAYKKGKVKAMVTRRNPMVENKTRELANITSGTEIVNPTDFQALEATSTGAISAGGIFNLLPLHNFTTQFQVGMRNQVDNSDRINGVNIFGKYLTAKGIVRFPQGSDIPSLPQNLELIWGWCPAMHATTNTAPALGNITPANITAHIIQQVSEYLNAQSDQLRYIPKRDQHIQILGRKRIRPNLNKQYSAPPAAGAVVNEGSVPDKFWSVKWPLMKKFHYDWGGEIASDQPTISERCFNLNDHRLPFLCFYQPDQGSLYPGDQDRRPAVAYNSMFYFTDS